MKRIFLLLAISVGVVVTGNGQTVQDGKSHLFAQRFELAEQTFQQLLKANPADPDALYWGGQAAIERELDSVKKIGVARAWYDKALQAAANSPLVMVGAGHADLLENKKDEARQKFESALTMSRTRKGENIDILNAVSRSNIEAKNGDLNYAIGKMNAQIEKGDKNAEMYLLLGNAIRKARPGEGGGEAFQNYQEALKLNPGYALAHYRLARLFDSQKNWELVLQYLTQCVEKDPRFTPAYYELFYYYFYRRDYVTAEKQLQQFIETKQPEKNIQDEFLYSQLCWARGDFACAIAKSEQVIAALGAATKPRVYRLLADAFFQQGDTLAKQQQLEAASASFANAKKYSDQFFGRTGDDMDGIALYDYQLRADIIDKTGGTPAEVFDTYLQSTRVDTLVNLKVDLLKKGADRFKAKGDSLSRIIEGDLRTLILTTKTNPSQRDLFDAGFAYYQGKSLGIADSLFGVYVTKYPEESFGYMMKYNIQRAIDTSMELGSAVPWAEKYLVILEKDTVKNKKTIIGVAGYLAAYSANVLKDKEKALVFLRRMLSLDPTNAAIQQNINVLEKTPAAKPDNAPKTDQSPKSAAVPKNNALIRVV
ncbi:MAG: tetratricopeptide repeat protein [Sphingomonadales bacterium]|nr:tetratricopeptide repeat protein [Sphingomonadales bacterium]